MQEKNRYNKRICSKDGCEKEVEEHRRKRYAYCLSCHAANMRLHRPKHKDLPDEQRKKANARGVANVGLKRGQIQRLPCRDCGDIKSEKHHEDYSKPLEVIWLCRKHHLELHRRKNEEIKTKINEESKTVQDGRAANTGTNANTNTSTAKA